MKLIYEKTKNNWLKWKKNEKINKIETYIRYFIYIYHAFSCKFIIIIIKWNLDENI